MLKFFKIILAAGLFVLVSIPELFAQADTSAAEVGYIDQTDLSMVIRGKKRAKKDNTGIPKKGKLMFFAAPVIGSNPSLGFFYGLGGSGAIFLGPPENTSISNLSASVLFTTKEQFISTLRGTIMTTGNKWEMLVDLKYSITSENTFGLGSDYNQPIQESWNFGGIQTTGLSGEQPMEFDQIRLHYTALRQLVDNVYAGVGFHYDYHYNIKDLSLDLEAPEPVLTSHYAYSTIYGFDPEEYVSVGTSVNFVFDSRDHTVNTYKGSFLQASYRVNSRFLGSERDYQQLYLEARVFKSLSKEMPRHIIGLWFIGHFTTSGDVPYLHLPASAYDIRNRMGRGYVVGRFRGTSWITAETEYRFPITKNGLFGGVLFGSMTTTSRDAIQIGDEYLEKLSLFDALRPAGGFGARIMLNRTGRMNLGLDMAYGQNGSKGFYFTVTETF